jgi:quercetin dioxygenase-like cupin family protein
MITRIAAIGSSLLLVFLVSGTSRADTFTPISLGTLPNGLVAENYAFTFDPGGCTPWHIHPGPLWVTLTAGQLTEEKGCGIVHVYNAGDTFSEAPGAIHRVCVTSSVPVAATVFAVLPPCFTDFNDEIDLTKGPICLGNHPLSLDGPFLCPDGVTYSDPAFLSPALCSDEENDNRSKHHVQWPHSARRGQRQLRHGP